MRVSAKADYAVRAMVELASSAASEESPAKGETLAEAQSIPLRFLENILGELRIHHLVQGAGGADGGYWLARDPGEITLGDVVRAVEGPPATVHGMQPQEVDYRGSAEPLSRVWQALGANIGEVLESVTLADVVAGELPETIGRLAEDADASRQSESRLAGGAGG